MVLIRLQFSKSVSSILQKREVLLLLFSDKRKTGDNTTSPFTLPLGPPQHQRSPATRRPSQRAPRLSSRQSGGGRNHRATTTLHHHRASLATIVQPSRRQRRQRARSQRSRRPGRRGGSRGWRHWRRRQGGPPRRARPLSNRRRRPKRHTFMRALSVRGRGAGGRGWRQRGWQPRGRRRRPALGAGDRGGGGAQRSRSSRWARRASVGRPRGRPAGGGGGGSSRGGGGRGCQRRGCARRWNGSAARRQNDVGALGVEYES